jgi:hypothetical protein
MIVVAALIVTGGIVWAAMAVAREIASARQAVVRGRTLELLELFASAMAAADADPRALLVWQPVARVARQLFPDECASFDRAAGSPVPFSRDRIQAAHAQWTAEWLAWERAHDAEYKMKAAAAEQELAASGGSAALRARVEAVEREKLERYQRRYEDYIRVAKALQALAQNFEAS